MAELEQLRKDALDIFYAGLRAADPRAAVLRALHREGDELWVNDIRIASLARGRVIVVGVGKAGAPMAQAVEEVLGDEIAAGAVTVKYDHLAPTRKIRLLQAGHPLPDENGGRATREMVQLVQGLSADDLVICLISGGGSALMEWLVEGVTLDDLRVFTNELLRAGATIYELNTLRKHFSRVKGGQLARLAQPARVAALILSDVLGSPPDVIASGPTVPDSSTFADCLAIVSKYDLAGRLPRSILAYYQRGARGEAPETPKANDPLFARVTNVIVADNELACAAASAEAEARGYTVNVVSTALQGEARMLGMDLAMRAQRAPARGCVLAGGEPTVMVDGTGKGGRAQELVLAAARELAGNASFVALSAGTDGTDGPTDAAGAIADNLTLSRAAALGLDANAYLENNDSYHFFKALDDLIITGPTNTNVNDLMVFLRGSD